MEIPATVTLDETRDDVMEINIISDAAVHVEEGKGRVCWRAIDTNDRVYSERFPIEVEKQDSYSYRQEMIGLFHALERALWRFPALEVIRCHCDYQAGIYNIQGPTPDIWPGRGYRPRYGCDSGDPRVGRAAHEGKDITFHHVRGHTDEKLKPGEEANRIEVQNVECDREAEECKDERPVQFEPLPGSKYVIRVADKWVTTTTRVDTVLQDIISTARIRLYLLEGLMISEWELDDIDTDALGAARSVHNWSRTARTSKMLLVQWLPVGRHWFHHGAHNSLCPCCGEPNETAFEHLFVCPNKDLEALRAVA